MRARLLLHDEAAVSLQDRGAATVTGIPPASRCGGQKPRLCRGKLGASLLRRCCMRAPLVSAHRVCQTAWKGLMCSAVCNHCLLVDVERCPWDLGGRPDDAAAGSWGGPSLSLPSTHQLSSSSLGLLGDVRVRPCGCSWVSHSWAKKNANGIELTSCWCR